jgi:hypothetical protein
VTNHAGVDYAKVVDRAQLVVDCRNATRGLAGSGRVVGL